MGDMHRQCPKCDSAMETGYLNDLAHSVVMQSTWAPGVPEIRRFIGGIKWKRKESVPVTTFRCPRCGYLESYAPG